MKELSETAVSPHQLLLLEHPPTYTLGRSGKLGNLLLTEAQLNEAGFALRWVESGPLVRSSYHAEQQVRALSKIYQG